MRESIHDKAIQIAGNFKKYQSELIDIIQEIDDKKSFYEKKCTSTFDYCVKFLKLSDDVSLDLIAIGRKSKVVPELKAAIQNEVITLSKARRLTSVITQKNSSHWIGLAQTLTKDKLQKEIARVNPQVLTPEKVRYVTEERLKLELGVSEEIMGDLKRAREILSQRSKGNISFEGTLGAVLKEFLKREDPVRKAERVLEKQKSSKKESKLEPRQELQSSAQQNLSGLGRVEEKQAFPFERVPLRANLKHQVVLRDNDQCTHIDSANHRCSERKWLHLHHVEHVKNGGQNELRNLKTLCFAHHKMQHL